MDLNDIHTDIKLFIGDFSEKNLKTHELGSVKAFSFKSPKIVVFFKSSNSGQSNCIVSFNNKHYSEFEFVKFLKLKIYW